MQAPRDRRAVSTAVIVLVAVLGCLALASPFIFFVAVFGDPLGRAYVERRADGLYAQLRACDGDSVHTVEVAEYGGSTDQLPAPFWSATERVPGSADSVRLFSTQPGFEASTLDRNVPAVFEVVINRGALSESSLTVSPGAVNVGDVVYGGESPVPRAEYEAMSGSDFGC